MPKQPERRKQLISINDKPLREIFAAIVHPFSRGVIYRNRLDPFMPAQYAFAKDVNSLLGFAEQGTVERLWDNGDRMVVTAQDDGKNYSFALTVERDGKEYTSQVVGTYSEDRRIITLSKVMIDNINLKIEHRNELYHFLNYIGQQYRQFCFSGIPHLYAKEPYFKPLGRLIERHNPWSNWRNTGVRQSQFSASAPQ